MTTTTTMYAPWQPSTADARDIIYVLAALAGLMVVLIAVVAWSRWRYRKEQAALMATYVEQQAGFIGALKAEAAHYRTQTAVMGKEMCEIKERMARELGELRGQMASLERIMQGRCLYYQAESPDHPGCLYCTHPQAWARVPAEKEEKETV